MIAKIMELPGATPVVLLILAALTIYIADRVLRTGRPPYLARWAIPMLYVSGGAALMKGVDLLVVLLGG